LKEVAQFLPLCAGLFERISGKGLEVLLKLLAGHFSQRMAIRDQLKVELVAGGLELL
jgi:hypothetical protein